MIRPFSGGRCLSIDFDNGVLKGEIDKLLTSGSPVAMT